MFGCHINGNLYSEIKNIHNMGGRLIQCFITDPVGKKTLIMSDDEINYTKKYLKKYNMNMIIHAPYVLNFARDFDLNIKEPWWIKTLLKELEIASKIGAKGSVIHFGKYLHLDKYIAIQNMVNSLKYIINKMPNNVFIYLETSCGQGSELGYTIEEFSKIYNQFSDSEKQKIKICIDTCHIFVAGYDIKTKIGFDSFINKFNSLIGIQFIKLIHLNDSNKELNSHLDRHDIIGDGFIGLEGLKNIYNWATQNNIDIIMETGGSFKKQFNLLKK